MLGIRTVSDDQAAWRCSRVSVIVCRPCDQKEPIRSPCWSGKQCWRHVEAERRLASVIRTRVESQERCRKSALLSLLSLIRAKSLPGSAPQAPGRAVARDHALLQSRDGRFVARARRA